MNKVHSDGKTYYAVFDTNVLVSALLTKHADSATVQLVGRLINGEIVPVYSELIMKEYREVLGRKKFKFNPDLIKYILSVIKKYGRQVEPSSTDVILADIKDLPFYEVVMEEQDNGAYLVTGNLKHFPSEPFVVTARQMINLLDGKECFHD